MGNLAQSKSAPPQLTTIAPVKPPLQYVKLGSNSMPLKVGRMPAGVYHPRSTTSPQLNGQNG